nr:MAG TPA: hypothetical protein [Caudoviricetes sp.]
MRTPHKWTYGFLSPSYARTTKLFNGVHTVWSQPVKVGMWRLSTALIDYSNQLM